MRRTLYILFLMGAYVLSAQVGVTVDGDAVLFINNETLVFSKGKFDVKKDTDAANGSLKSYHTTAFAETPLDASDAFSRQETAADVLNYGYLKVDGDFTVAADADFKLKYDPSDINNKPYNGLAEAGLTNLKKKANDNQGQLIVKGTSSVSGKIGTERYYYKGNESYKWVYYSSPFSTFTVDDFNSKKSDGSLRYAAANTVAEWAMVLRLDVQNQIWIQNIPQAQSQVYWNDLVPTPGTYAMAPGDSHVFLVGDLGVGTAVKGFNDIENQTLLTHSGTPTNGVVSKDLYYGEPMWSNELINGGATDGAYAGDNNEARNGSQSGWNLLGNPYTSYIDVCEAIKTLNGGTSAEVVTSFKTVVYRDGDAANGFPGNPFFEHNCSTGSGPDQARFVAPYEGFQVQVKAESTVHEQGGATVVHADIKNMALSDLKVKDAQFVFNDDLKTFVRASDKAAFIDGFTNDPKTSGTNDLWYPNMTKSSASRSSFLDPIIRSKPNSKSVSAYRMGDTKWDRVGIKLINSEGGTLDWSEVIFKKGMTDTKFDIIEAYKTGAGSKTYANISSVTPDRGLLLTNSLNNTPGKIVPLNVNLPKNYSGGKIRVMNVESVYGYSIYLEDRQNGEFYTLNAPVGDQIEPVELSISPSDQFDRFFIHYGEKPQIVDIDLENANMGFSFNEKPGKWVIEWNDDLINVKKADKIIWRMYDLDGNRVAWVSFNPEKFNSNKFRYTHNSKSLNRINSMITGNSDMIIKIIALDGTEVVEEITKTIN